MPFVYIVQCADGTLYTGWALDVLARVKVHNAGRGAKYTQMRRPVRLVYSERWPSRAEAMRREREIKRWTRARKEALFRRNPGRRVPKL
jgi:putative endonuclease